MCSHPGSLHGSIAWSAREDSVALRDVRHGAGHPTPPTLALQPPQSCRGQTGGSSPECHRSSASCGSLLPPVQQGTVRAPRPRPAAACDDGSCDAAADAEVQAYNFRLCVTQGDPKNLSGTRASFTKPEGYDPARWELLRRFWRDTWPKSTSPHRAAQAKVPTAILGRIPNRNGAWPKYDMNNCGYNPIHTDMIGGSKQYPTANYSERVAIWNAHVDYTLGE